MNSEIWEIIDENGRGTGKFCKRCERETIPDGLFHAVVEVWVRVGEHIFLTQRHPDKWAGLMWEASGGAALAGERLTESAVRELEEETGARAGKYTYLGVLDTTPALIDEKIHMYLAEDLTFGEMHLDEDEFLSVQKFPMTKLIDMVMSGEIRDSKTQIAILKAARILGIN